MIRKTLQIGNPKLREKSKEITLDFFKSKEFASNKQDLLDTLRGELLGVAISAIQVGLPIQLFLIEVRAKPVRSDIKPFGPKFYINPVIVKSSSEKTFSFEGCISVFNSQLFGEVERPKFITLKYLDENFKEIVEEFDEFYSRVIQHEVDHLNGILFTDIVKVDTITTLDEYRKSRSRDKDK